jgi:lipoprotein-anchoring transpeptidase ErfK/SrfK
VAGFSDVLETFGGGVGQIAMHGTNRPDLIGGKVSHGCVRMTNQSITQLKDLAPPGTPVEIVP